MVLGTCGWVQSLWIEQMLFVVLLWVFKVCLNTLELWMILDAFLSKVLLQAGVCKGKPNQRDYHNRAAEPLLGYSNRDNCSKSRQTEFCQAPICRRGRDSALDRRMSIIYYNL